MTHGPIHVELSHDPLDLLKACAFVSDPAHGAIDLFVGMVRNHHEGQIVTGMTYDAHKGLAEKAMREICDEATDLWPGTRYYVAHYHGTLVLGEASVIIAVSAAHRAEAFEGCRYVIEELKKRVPVWKQEHYPDGKSAWLPGHALEPSCRDAGHV